MSSPFIEDETKNSYTLRTDLLNEGDIIQCRDDKDMIVKKECDCILLIKKAFRKPFNK